MNDTQPTDPVGLQLKGARRHLWLYLAVAILLMNLALMYFGPQIYVWHQTGRYITYDIYGGWFPYITRFPPDALHQLLILGAPIFVCGVLLTRALLTRWIRSNQQPKGVSNLHGSAQWATRQEVAETGLAPDWFTTPRSRKPHKGVVLGGYRDPKTKRIVYLKDDGPSHVLLFAPSRTGKGVTIVIPTALDWEASLFAFDLKGEIYRQTAGFRKQVGQRIFKFDPCSDQPDVAGYNPLKEIRMRTKQEVSDCQTIAQMVVDPDATGETDHWAMTAQALLTGIMLHLRYVHDIEKNGRVATFQDVIGWFGGPGTMEDRLKQMQNYPHLRNRPHPVVFQEIQSMIDKPEKERGSVFSSAEKYLKIYRDPIVGANMSRSDWTPEDLVDSDIPATVYFIISPANLERMQPVIRLVIMQLVRKLMEVQQDFDTQGRPMQMHAHRLLMLLDEFTSLKRMASIEDTIGYSASYGIKYLIVCQDIIQLTKTYGRDHALLSNCDIRVTFRANDPDTAKKICEMIGKTTVVKQQFSSSGKRSKIRNESLSTSISEVARDLLRPEEIMSLKGSKIVDRELVEPGDLLVFPSGHKPIYGRQTPYFFDPVYLERSKIAPPRRSHTMDPNRNRKRKSRDTVPDEEYVEHPA